MKSRELEAMLRLREALMREVRRDIKRGVGIDKPIAKNPLWVRQARATIGKRKKGGFKRLERKLSRRKGVRSPRALAAWIERRAGRIP